MRYADDADQAWREHVLPGALRQVASHHTISALPDRISERPKDSDRCLTFVCDSSRMLNKLSRLLWAGGIRVAICALAVLCIGGLLEFTTAHLTPSRQVAEQQKFGCMPSRCRAKAAR